MESTQFPRIQGRMAVVSPSCSLLWTSGLSASELGKLLKESGIRHKVVVISACYSGGFIDAVRSDHTLVITAARHDRTSFGCSDENELRISDARSSKRRCHRAALSRTHSEKHRRWSTNGKMKT
ncbi:MAG TPA: C13 family peptidase [Burkholderiales bacterium]|nr:C13 family peptidase [Burkholderiales bacterium]